MKHIFYLIGIVFIIKEWLWITNPKGQLDRTKKWSSAQKENEGRNTWSEYTDEYKSFLILKVVPSLVILVWVIVGLFTFNWLAFLAIIIFNIAVINPISNQLEHGTSYMILHWFNSVLGFAFGVFVILNSYHLKIDLYAAVAQWLGI